MTDVDPGPGIPSDGVELDETQVGPAPTARRRQIRRPSVSLGDVEVSAGKATIGEIPVSRLVTGNRVSIPINVLHGRHEGPVVWLSAAVHGDEIGGVEIIRRSLQGIDPKTLAGTIVAVPDRKSTRLNSSHPV